MRESSGLRHDGTGFPHSRKLQYELCYDDIEQYHHIISALSETMRLMKEIDEVIAEAGGFPLR
jgi:hypothetical protein